MSGIIPPGKHDVGGLLEWAVAFLTERGVQNPLLEAELLMADVTGTPRWNITLEPQKTITVEQKSLFISLIGRRGKREPLQYILGRQEFYSLEFPVDRGVLIPRPETELVVETAIDKARTMEGDLLLIDMGCGCGNMSIVLSRELPTARIIAVDISQDAVLCTHASAEKFDVTDKISIVCGDMFNTLRKGLKADIIVSNPPYIDSAEIDTLQPEVSRFEPRRALDGGEEGLEVIRKLAVFAPDYLVKGGYLIFEAGASQAAAIKKIIAPMNNWSSHKVLKDHAGHQRVHLLEKE